jgi:hypothetical protein
VALEPSTKLGHTHEACPFIHSGRLEVIARYPNLFSRTRLSSHARSSGIPCHNGAVGHVLNHYAPRRDNRSGACADARLSFGVQRTPPYCPYYRASGQSSGETRLKSSPVEPPCCSAKVLIGQKTRWNFNSWFTVSCVELGDQKEGDAPWRPGCK